MDIDRRSRVGGIFQSVGSNPQNLLMIRGRLSLTKVACA
jgi:hypothetical protein